MRPGARLRCVRFESVEERTDGALEVGFGSSVRKDGVGAPSLLVEGELVGFASGDFPGFPTTVGHGAAVAGFGVGIDEDQMVTGLDQFSGRNRSGASVPRGTRWGIRSGTRDSVPRGALATVLRGSGAGCGRGRGVSRTILEEQRDVEDDPGDSLPAGRFEVGPYPGADGRVNPPFEAGAGLLVPEDPLGNLPPVRKPGSVDHPHPEVSAETSDSLGGFQNLTRDPIGVQDPSRRSGQEGGDAGLPRGDPAQDRVDAGSVGGRGVGPHGRRGALGQIGGVRCTWLDGAGYPERPPG